MKGVRDSERDFDSNTVMQLLCPSHSPITLIFFINTHKQGVKHHFDTTNITTLPPCLSPSGNLDRLHQPHSRPSVSRYIRQIIYLNSSYNGLILCSRLGTPGRSKWTVSYRSTVPRLVLTCQTCGMFPNISNVQRRVVAPIMGKALTTTGCRSNRSCSECSTPPLATTSEV